MRLLIFTDSNNLATVGLIKATVSLARAANDMEVCGVVTSKPDMLRSTRRLRATRFARHVVTAATNADVQLRRDFPRRLDHRWLTRNGLPVYEPLTGNANDPEFLAFLRDEVQPDVALSYYCARIFKLPLLQTFEQTVNFHNGLLPRYKGLMATSFSLYAGDAHTGFTFHRMTEAIDAGPILVQDSIPVADDDDVQSVTSKLIATAIASLPHVLELVRANDPGRPQAGAGSYFSGKDVSAMIHLRRPEELTEDELHLRLWAFGTVWINLDGAWYPVTRLRRARARDDLRFRSADGAVLSPDRLDQLPRRVYRNRQRRP